MAALAGLPDGFGHGARFLKNVNVREPQDLDSPSFQGRAASRVGLASSRREVLSTIHLNGEAQFMTVEVEHIWVYWMLASELDAHLTAADQPPEHEFRAGLAFSEGARQVDEAGRSFLVGRVGMRQRSSGRWAVRPEDSSPYRLFQERD